MPKLIFDDVDSDDDFKIDNEYAKSYDKWRQKEELNRLKTKYVTASDESDTSDDDDDGEGVTNVLEKDFLKTLSCLKNKDPCIYDQHTNFFKDEIDNKDQKKKKEKPLFINDYDRKLLLENGEDIDEDNVEIKQERDYTYVEEQKKLKENLQEALKTFDKEDENNMFKLKEKAEDENEENYKNWLCGIEDQLKNKDDEQELKPLKEFWTDPNLDESEKFLRDYILNKKFLDSRNDGQDNLNSDDEKLSEDETLLEQQENFEQKYNFRFEDPDEEFIKRYPRTLQNSLRREDDKRKVKRAEIKERKKSEKMQKMEELKQLQMLKKKEIEEKIKQLVEITGNTGVAFKEEDIDGDFDPDSHDKRMQNLFNEEFYGVPEEDKKPEFRDLDEELEIENWDRWEGTNVEPENDLHCEDEGFNMDCDYDPTTSNIQQELIKESKGKKKRKRKSKFAKLVSEPKPLFDPKDKTFQQYLDEYYKFDCEDVIGDIPCKFKYREVIPNNFGLSIEEILLAKDKELNRWCSIKKAVQHRPEHVEKYDVIAYNKKSKNEDLKKKILPSLFAEDVLDKPKSEQNAEETEIMNIDNKETSSIEVPVQKKSKKRKRSGVENDVIANQEETNTLPDIQKQNNNKKMKREIEENLTIIGNTAPKTSETINEVEESLNISTEIPKRNKNKRKKKNNNKLINKNDSKIEIPFNRRKIDIKKKGKANELDKCDITNARLSAYGINKKKFKNKFANKKMYK